MSEQRYRVLVLCHNDATGKSYRPGRVIGPKAFPAEVIENWLEIGVLREELAAPVATGVTGEKKEDDGGR